MHLIIAQPNGEWIAFVSSANHTANRVVDQRDTPIGETYQSSQGCRIGNIRLPCVAPSASVVDTFRAPQKTAVFRSHEHDDAAVLELNGSAFEQPERTVADTCMLHEMVQAGV